MEAIDVLNGLPVYAGLIVIAGVVLTGLSFLEILARVGPRQWLAPIRSGGEEGGDGSRGNPSGRRVHTPSGPYAYVRTPAPAQPTPGANRGKGYEGVG